MKITDKNYPEFKKEFWKWFDSLPYHKRQMFYFFKEDMAETHFYFTTYSKEKEDRCQHSEKE